MKIDQVLLYCCRHEVVRAVNLHLLRRASVLRSMDTPIYTAWLAQSIDPKERAIVLSMS